MYGKFADHLIRTYVYPTLLQATTIEALLYCCNKLANSGTNTHKPELLLLSFGNNAKLRK